MVRIVRYRIARTRLIPLYLLAHFKTENSSHCTTQTHCVKLYYQDNNKGKAVLIIKPFPNMKSYHGISYGFRAMIWKKEFV